MSHTRHQLVCITLLLTAIEAMSAEIHFESFDSTKGLSLVGAAALSGSKAIRLTPARPNRTGAVWFVEKQPIGAGFDTTFRFQLTGQGGLGRGADGFAFVLQNSGPDALGGRGSAGGFAVADANFHPRSAGIPWSIAVFFDTFKNDEEADPSANYVAFRTQGRPAEIRWPAERLAFTPSLPVELKDRKVHSARIFFQPPVLSIFLDGSNAPVLEAKVDLSVVLDPQGKAWVGFTASTGGGYENHDVRDWTFTSAQVSSSMSIVASQITFLMAACLPERNLCTPERSVVEQSGSGYHVVLPANLEWGVSVLNRSAARMTVTNAHGIACWDMKAKGSDGCSGPTGTEVPAGAGFLYPDAGAGALIMKTSEGRTWFSVNGRDGSGFKDNQGFYEFDLEVK